jgi:peptidoglycan hydrolase-like protein with peptidoglycan-binding domain
VAVSDLQVRLNQAGATPQLKVDGMFGPKPYRAVRRYQALSGMTVDGTVGKQSWLGLGVYKAPASRANEKEREEALSKVTIDTVGHGSSTAAIAAASALQGQQWKNLDLVGLKQLAGLTIEIHVIPNDKKLTDLPDFASLRGTTTFDGRLWDDVRGINMGKSGTKIRSAVAEEALISIRGKPSGYGPGFVAAHENGHAVRNALSADQNTKLQKLFDDRKAAHAPPAQNAADDEYWLSPSWYAGANSDEYWANSVAAYYNHPYNTTETVKKMYTSAWLATNDPKMYAFLKSVF